MKRNGLIIPLTTPINLSILPKKSCYGSYTDDAKEEVKNINALLLKKDYKAAYGIAHELALLNPSNATINFLYANVLHKLNRFNEAQKYAELAVAYDCQNMGANPVYNAILRKLSLKHGFDYLDFHKLLVDESQSNFVFLDETYPQDFYMEKVIDALAIRIKNRLKL